MNLNSTNNKFWEDNNEFIGDSGSGGVVDAILSTTSTNPVQNKVITNTLASHFKAITSGSVHDVTTNGIYYVTSAATDKPTNSGGLMIVCYYSTTYHIRLFIPNSPNPKWYIYRHSGPTTIDWMEL